MIEVPDDSPSDTPNKLRRSVGDPRDVAAGAIASGPMAFTPGTKQWPCASCSTMKTYHKLMTSYRPEHALKRQ
eukprot:8624741-Lingulodinium_polyedra.AAC.1